MSKANSTRFQRNGNSSRMSFAGGAQGISLVVRAIDITLLALTQYYNVY